MAVSAPSVFSLTTQWTPGNQFLPSQGYTAVSQCASLYELTSDPFIENLKSIQFREQISTVIIFEIRYISTKSRSRLHFISEILTNTRHLPDQPEKLCFKCRRL